MPDTSEHPWVAFLRELKRPLVFVDLETTSADISTARIVQIACVKYVPPSGAPDDAGDIIEKNVLVNPGIPIPAEATAIHHITDEMVAGAPTFKALSKSMADFFEGADIGGFNVKRFDWPLLLNEWARAGFAEVGGERYFVDVLTIFHKMHPRDLKAAVKTYLMRDFTEAHDALADITATVDVFAAQLAVHPELPRDVDELSAYLFPKAVNAVDADSKFAWVAGEAVVNFGKNKGVKLRDLDAGFLRWMQRGDFSKEVKGIVEAALRGVFPKKE